MLRRDLKCRRPGPPSTARWEGETHANAAARGALCPKAFGQAPEQGVALQTRRPHLERRGLVFADRIAQSLQQLKAVIMETVPYTVSQLIIGQALVGLVTIKLHLRFLADTLWQASLCRPHVGKLEIMLAEHATLPVGLRSGEHGVATDLCSASVRLNGNTGRANS